MTKHNETLEALKRMSEEDPDGFSNDILALIDYKCKTATAEAIKEFAERLKQKARFCLLDFNKITDTNEGVQAIDNLVKEMVGED